MAETRIFVDPENCGHPRDGSPGSSDACGLIGDHALPRAMTTPKEQAAEVLAATWVCVQGAPPGRGLPSARPLDGDCHAGISRGVVLTSVTHLAPLFAEERRKVWDEGVDAAFRGAITRQNGDDVKRSNPYRERADTYAEAQTPTTTTKENES